LWFLRHRRPPVDIALEVARFREPVQAFATGLADCMRGALRDAVDAMTAHRIAQGVPAGLAGRSATWRLLHTTFDVIELAERVGVPPHDACVSYWGLFDRLELMWLWDGIGALPRSDRWQTQARGSLRDDLLSALSELTENVLDSPERTVDRWWSANQRSVQRAMAQLTEIRRADAFDITNLSVGLRQLRNLALASDRV
jgi:glutamate dehydrogenase